MCPRGSTYDVCNRPQECNLTIMIGSALLRPDSTTYNFHSSEAGSHVAVPQTALSLWRDSLIVPLPLAVSGHL
jgi:hypothetical protein